MSSKNHFKRIKIKNIINSKYPMKSKERNVSIFDIKFEKEMANTDNVIVRKLMLL